MEWSKCSNWPTQTMFGMSFHSPLVLRPTTHSKHTSAVLVVFEPVGTPIRHTPFDHSSISLVYFCVVIGSCFLQNACVGQTQRQLSSTNSEGPTSLHNRVWSSACSRRCLCENLPPCRGSRRSSLTRSLLLRSLRFLQAPLSSWTSPPVGVCTHSLPQASFSLVAFVHFVRLRLCRVLVLIRLLVVYRH